MPPARYLEIENAVIESDTDAAEMLRHLHECAYHVGWPFTREPIRLEAWCALRFGGELRGRPGGRPV